MYMHSGWIISFLKKIDGLSQQICDVIESDCKLELNDGSKRNNAYEERTHASSSKGQKLLNQQKRFQCENERNLTNCDVCRFKCSVYYSLKFFYVAIESTIVSGIL